MRLFSSHQVRNRQSQIDPIVPTLPPTRRACATHPYAQQYRCGSLCLSESAVRISPSALPGTYQIFFSYFFTYTPRLAYLYHPFSPCCFFWVFLCVIQQCHCSSCARHSAPTAEAGSILCAYGRCALHSQYYSSNVCCCRRHWPIYAHTYLAVCGRHFLLRADHLWIVCIHNQSVVRASCTAAFVQKYLQ